MNCTEVVRSLNQPPKTSVPSHWKICIEHANDSPAINAPPGRRTPKVTATASHTSPASGVAVVFETWKLTMPSREPPKPAMPAESANTRIFARVGEMPDVRAATSVLRTASIARPVADRWSAYSASVMSPNVASRSSTCCWGWEKSRWSCLPGTNQSATVLRPGMSSDAGGMLHPRVPWLTE